MTIKPRTCGSKLFVMKQSYKGSCECTFGIDAESEQIVGDKALNTDMHAGTTYNSSAYCKCAECGKRYKTRDKLENYRY